MTEFRKHHDKTKRQVLVGLDLHGTDGMLGTGRSSSAEAAAKAITALVGAVDRYAGARMPLDSRPVRY